MVTIWFYLEFKGYLRDLALEFNFLTVEKQNKKIEIGVYFANDCSKMIVIRKMPNPINPWRKPLHRFRLWLI